jgi:glycosyltransferase involved in cell wall biosynthesis
MPPTSLVHNAGGTRSNVETSAPPPLLSVVIVVFRDRDELRQIIESILPHNNEDLEIIVIDGGSDDGTTELLQSFGHEIAYWVSEPDSGIYDAMNKGIAAARGEYILHLNAGDRLRMVPWDALRDNAAAGVDVVCCKVLIDGHIEFVSRTSLLTRIANTWHHQGTFYRRVAHLGYDATYRTHGDFDHNQRILKAGSVIKDHPFIVADHQSGGASMAKTRHRETYRSVRTNFGWFYVVPAWFRCNLLDLRNWIRTLGKIQVR